MACARGEGWRYTSYFHHRRGDPAATIVDIGGGRRLEANRAAIAAVPGKPCGARLDCMTFVHIWAPPDRQAKRRAETLERCTRDSEPTGVPW